MVYNVYLDESGDLGWKFTSPYRSGGSSRYLTIAFIICPTEKKHLPKRIVRKVYNKFSYPTNVELKGSSLDVTAKEFVASETVKMSNNNPDIILVAITVKKENVETHIQTDGNKIYNYMLKLSLLDKIKKASVVNLIRDKRTIKVKSGNSLVDYLQTELWFEKKVATKLIDIPSESHVVHNLKFIDWINNLIWSHYEDSNSSAFRILLPKIDNQKLFF